MQFRKIALNILAGILAAWHPAYAAEAPPGDLNLVEPMDYQVFQRQSISEGIVRLRGRLRSGQTRCRPESPAGQVPMRLGAPGGIWSLIPSRGDWEAKSLLPRAAGIGSKSAQRETRKFSRDRSRAHRCWRSPCCRGAVQFHQLRFKPADHGIAPCFQLQWVEMGHR